MSRIIYPKLTQIPRIICIMLVFGIFNVVHAQQPDLEPITIGENKVATVSAGVSHDFSFSAAAGQTITIQALAITPGLAPAFAVLEIDATLVESFDNPDLTFSARILRSMIDQGIGGTGRSLAAQYRDMLQQEPLEVLSEEDFVAEREASVQRQREIEASETESFDAFLAKHG